MKTFNQTSQSAVYRKDDISVSLTVCGGSYGGGSEVLVVSYGFKPRNGSDARSIGYEEERSPSLVADSHCGGAY